MEIAALADFYAELLPERSRDILDKYYNQDMSLGEIAELTGISRQGVRDYISRASAALSEYESKLHMRQKYFELRQEIENFLHKLRTQEILSSEIEEFLKKLMEKI